MSATRTGHFVQFERGTHQKRDGEKAEFSKGPAIYHGSVTEAQAVELERIVHAYLDQIATAGATTRAEGSVVSPSEPSEAPAAAVPGQNANSRFGANSTGCGQVPPQEPTEEMIDAICAAGTGAKWPEEFGQGAQDIRRENARKGYAAIRVAMLAAAPGVEDWNG